jgi:DNA polymerase III epsilon subunit-like protein
MKVLVFDTETSGLPTPNNIPTIVQFSYVKFDMATRKIEKEVDRIIEQPTGFVIPQESINIHRVTNEQCAAEGVNVLGVLQEFWADVEECDRVVGHNVSFDVDRVASVFNKMTHSRYPEEVRREYQQKLKYLSNILVPKLCCTMKSTIDFCNLVKTNVRGRSYKKFPKLAELYQKLFDTIPSGLHNSLVDVYACLRCYVAIENGVEGRSSCGDLEILNRLRVLQGEEEEMEEEIGREGTPTEVGGDVAEPLVA